MKKVLAALLLLTFPASAQVGQIPIAVVPTPAPQPAFFIATSGSDFNPGTIAQPFATLGKCQTAMEGSSTKTCYVRAGTYTPSPSSANVSGCNQPLPAPATLVQLTHAKGDDGTTYSYYPPDGIGNAIFDGSSSIPVAICAYHVKNVTVTGLTFQHFKSAPLYMANWDANDGNGQGDTFSNNTVLNTSPGGNDPCINGAGYIQNARFLNNFVQNCGGQGIGVSNTQASAVGGLTGVLISGNVVYNGCTAGPDCGLIYLQDYQLPASTNIKVTGNYVYQSNISGTGGILYYLDDGTSNVTTSGNVGVAGGTLNACWLIHGGSNDVFTGNICDEGGGSRILVYQQTTHTPANFPMTGNVTGVKTRAVFSGNAIVCKASGNCGSGFVGLSPVAPNPQTASGNTYWNFGTLSGAVVSTGGGGANGDTNPIAANPNLACWSGFSTSFGPPGFVLPPASVSWCSTTNKGINASGGGWLSLDQLSAPNLAAVVSDFQALGLAWVRYGFAAQVIDPTCGSMTWGNNDAVIAALHNAGIRVMALLNEASPCMNGGGSSTQGPTTSAGRTAWAAFATAVAQRYGATGTAVAGGVQAYEIWNEPNCGVFWTPGADPVNYEALVASAYSALKGVDPAAVVITGGLSPCGTSGTTQSMQLFTANLYAAGLKGNENAIGIHPYCASPAGAAGCDNIRKMYDSTFLSGTGSACLASGTPDSCTILSIMAVNGDGGEQQWATEWGQGTTQQTCCQSQDNQTQQAADVTNVWTLFYNNRGAWAGPAFWYNYQDFATATGTGSDGKPQCTATDDPSSNPFLCMGLELRSATGVGTHKLSWSAMSSAP